MAMQVLTIRGDRGLSAIHVGGRIGDLSRLIPVEHSVIVTDTRVFELYGHLFPDCPVIAIGRGEGAKTLDTVRLVYERLAVLEAQRTTMLAGIGGGIVCDVTGFVAATYLRGLRCGLVATTLLAQVDAAVGGKNGVNLGGFKNMVGTIRQPEFVICDPQMLSTLPKAEIQCGLAEIVKHAAIADAGLFSFLEEQGGRLLALDPHAMATAVGDSVRIKAAVVERDESERGERRKLNFGHTFGHAIEKATGLSHGAAVGLGMQLAARFSVQRGLLAAEDAARLERLLEQLGLPLRLPQGGGAAVGEALRQDKKREGREVHFVLLSRIGQAQVVPLPLAEVERFLAEG